MGAALLAFDFDYGDLVRWLEGEYTNRDRDWPELHRHMDQAAQHPQQPGYPKLEFAMAKEAFAQGVPLARGALQQQSRRGPAQEWRRETEEVRPAHLKSAPASLCAPKDFRFCTRISRISQRSTHCEPKIERLKSQRRCEHGWLFTKNKLATTSLFYVAHYNIASYYCVAAACCCRSSASTACA